MLKPGTWRVTSESDPRWNGSGHSPLVGCFEMPKEAEDHIEKKKLELKTPPPPDLRWEYMKY